MERIVHERRSIKSVADIRCVCVCDDRNNIAAARLAGLERDLKLTSTEFQTAVSILFVG
jgi:hypothetical protein